MNDNTYGYTNASTGQPVKNNNKIYLIIIIVMAIVLLIESIIVVITLTKYFEVFGGEDYEVSIDEEDHDTLYRYDDNDNIIAINATCTNEYGTNIVLNKDNTYKKTANGTLDSSGSYTVTDDTSLELTPSSGGQKITFYYNELTLSDEENIYECEENGLSDDE